PSGRAPFPYTTLFRSERDLDPRLLQRALGRAELALAAVDEQQVGRRHLVGQRAGEAALHGLVHAVVVVRALRLPDAQPAVIAALDRKSTRLNSSHVKI